MQKIFMVTTAALATVAFAPMASAQAAGDTATTTVPADNDGDDDFPWGLLGLIGLAGLLGRKRDDRVRTDRH